MNAWLLLLIGFAVLVAGADLLVRGAVGLAARLGMAPLLIGLTVVAFGTSAPELSVSLQAVSAGQPDIAAGNAVGSNLFNIMFILGLSALIRPLLVQRKLVRVDVPVMIGVAGLFWMLGADGRIGAGDGSLLLAGLVGYLFGLFVASRKAQRAQALEPGAQIVIDARPRSLALSGALCAIGLLCAVAGSRWLVSGASHIASDLGVSELIIGLTILAAGTSLPEVATSVVAVVRGQSDIAVGNVVGSNVFNLLCIIGCAGLVAPGGLAISPAMLAFDIPVMVAVSIACLPIAFTGYEIRRWEGALLLLGYAAYTGYLILAASEHDALSGFSAIMLWFALPLAALGVAGSVLGSLRHARRERKGPRGP